MSRRAAAFVLGVAALGAFAVALIVASTASNTVPETKAGVGEGVITGYDVSSVHYQLNAADRRKLDRVSFTLDSAPVVGSTISVKLSAASADWYDCTNVATAVTCVTTSPQVLAPDATQLTVAVAQ